MDREKGKGRERLTTDTNPRPAIKGQILPPGPQLLPSLGSEYLRVLTEEIFTAVHGVQGPPDYCSLGDEERGFTLDPAAHREDGVGDGHAGIVGDHWVETECYTHTCSISKHRLGKHKVGVICFRWAERDGEQTYSPSDSI